MSCREARRIILAVLRREASDAERLRLDEHLADCPRCLEERGRAALLERLRDGPRPQVSAAARQRILGLPDEVVASAQPVAAARRSLRWPLLLLPAAAALALVIGVAVRAQHRPSVAPPTVALAAGSGEAPSTNGAAMLSPRPRATLPDASPSERLQQAVQAIVPPVVKGARLIVAEAPGEAPLHGAAVRYPAGAVLRIHDDQRRIDLLDGEVDVEVTPGGPGRFRVLAPRFIVEVVGTRFVVRRDGVHTLRGAVRVLDLDGRELAVVRAGQSWRAPASLAMARTEGTSAGGIPSSPPPTPAPPSPSTATPSPTPLPAGEAASRPATAPPSSTSSKLSPDEEAPASAPSAAALLEEARAALADGDTARARERLESVAAAHPSARQQAVADLLSANALLADGQPDRAVEAWRRVAARHPEQPEAEMALFAAAQLLSERGPAPAARMALEEYARRFPAGHFIGEVRDKLARSPGAP